MGEADPHDEFEAPNSGDEDPVEPLEIVPYPVPIEAYDPEVGGRSVVRLFFQPGDHAAAPEVDLAEVVILETWERVAIGLVRRGVFGEGPDGVNYGESLLRRGQVSLDVALAEPLGTRPLVDAWTERSSARFSVEQTPPYTPRRSAPRSGDSSETALALPGNSALGRRAESSAAPLPLSPEASSVDVVAATGRDPFVLKQHARVYRVCASLR